MVCSEFLGLRSSEVTAPLANSNPCVLFLTFLPAASCSGYFRASLGLLLSGWRVGAERLLRGPQPDGQGGGPRPFTEIMAELKVDSSSLTSQQGLCWTALAVLPLIFLVLLINLYRSLYSQGDKLLKFLSFALRHLSYMYFQPKSCLQTPEIWEKITFWSWI